MKYDYDIIIIGGGGAGITGAMMASGLGKKAALLDRGKFGGECTWSGCIPSKALIHSANAAHTIQDREAFGLKLKAAPVINGDGVLAKVRQTVEKVYAEEEPDHFEELGIKALENVKVSFLDSSTVDVDGQKMSAAKFLIATGSGPLVPPIPGLEKTNFLTNENIFQLKKVPRSMVIIGAGAIGIEMASAFNRLGTKITLLEMADSILFREDEELTGILHQRLVDEGVTILTGSRVEKVEGKKKITVHFTGSKGAGRITGDEVFVAIGRKPNTEGLGLEAAGVKYNAGGIVVDAKMRTSAGNIYAAGDVAGPYLFSHMANYQAIVAVSNALLPITKKADYSHVPWITFSDPELARSGLTETEAREKYGKKIRIFKTAFNEIDRGRTDDAGPGLAKVITSRKGKILGIHILGERAGELMHELHAAKSLGIPLYKLNDVIHAYPSWSDIIQRLARNAYVDKLQNNFFIKLMKKLRGTK